MAAINDFSTRGSLSRLADQVPLPSFSLRIGVEKSVANSYLPLPVKEEGWREGDFAFLQLFNIYDRSKK